MICRGRSWSPRGSQSAADRIQYVSYLSISSVEPTPTFFTIEEEEEEEEMYMFTKRSDGLGLQHRWCTDLFWKVPSSSKRRMWFRQRNTSKTTAYCIRFKRQQVCSCLWILMYVWFCLVVMENRLFITICCSDQDSWSWGPFLIKLEKLLFLPIGAFPTYIESRNEDIPIDLSFDLQEGRQERHHPLHPKREQWWDGGASWIALRPYWLRDNPSRNDQQMRERISHWVQPNLPSDGLPLFSFPSHFDSYYF